MKKAMNKTLLIAALSLSAVAFVGFGASAVESGSAELQDSTATVFEIDGAYVRIHEDGNNGIKFQTNYLAAEFPETDFEASGTLIVPADILASAELTTDTTTAKNLDTTEAWNVEGDYKTTYAYMYAIPEASYSRPLAVRSYVSYWEGEELITEYTDTETYTLSDLAAAAIEEAPQDGYDEETEKWLTQFSTVATAGSVVDFSLASNQAINNRRIEFVDEFKGETDVAKLTVEYEPDPNVWNGWFGITDWKVEFYKNYYKSYQNVAFDYYIDGAENMKNFYVRGWESWQLKIPVTIKDGWGSTTAGLWADYGGIFGMWGEGDLYNQWSKGIQFCSVCVEGQSFTVYVSALEAYNPVTVTNAATKKEPFKEFTVTDDSATALANCTNVSLTVFDPNGEKVEVTDGKFTPATAGSYRFLYKALDENGLNVRGEYTVTFEVYEAGLINDFSKGASSHWAPTGLRDVNATNPWIMDTSKIEYLDSYENATGVMKITYTRPQTKTSEWGPTFAAYDSNFFKYDKEDYAEYAETGKLYIRMRVESSYNYAFQISWVQNPWTIKAQSFIQGDHQFGYGIQMSDVKADWVVLSVDFKKFYEAFDALDKDFEIMFTDRMANGTVPTEDVVTNFYIDKIWVANPTNS